MKGMPTSKQELTRRSAREAAEWLRVLRDDPGATEREAFVEWLRASKLHVRELLLAGMVDRELARPGVFDGFDLDAALAAAAREDNVVALPDARHAVQARPHRRMARRWFGRAAAAIAAVAVLAGGLAFWRLAAAPTTQYATAIGETRAVTLKDGSVVRLAPGTRVAVDFSGQARKVVLQDGEADFDVAHDRTRPFRVYAGASVVQAVGTRFSVDRLPSGTVVSVSQGKVLVSSDRMAALDDGMRAWVATWLPGIASNVAAPEVKLQALNAPIPLAAGQALELTRNGRAYARTTPAERTVAPVGHGRLSFHDATLADIAAAFNRYNARQIVIVDKSLRTQRYSGVFDADDPRSFLQFLSCCANMQVAREGDRTVIRAGGHETRTHLH